MRNNLYVSTIGGGRRRGVHGDLVDELGQRIVSGSWGPGATLPNEADLAAQLSVSRTVLREALRVLASKGLVESRPKTGTRALDRSRWRLTDPEVLRWQLNGRIDLSLCRELLEVRAFFEPQAAAMAAQRRTDAEAERLAGLLRTMHRSVGDQQAYIVADLEFHGAIVLAMHNILLSQLTDTIHAALFAVRRVTTLVKDGPARAMARHEAVAEAVIAGHSDAAYTAMAALIEETRRDFEAVVSIEWPDQTAERPLAEAE